MRWYDSNRRDLPWRADQAPYHVWVSEIMLQQTRVSAVIEYYERFIRRFPDVHTLSRSRETSVLALWSGLGYYRRARSLHAAARVISRERNGVFPATSCEWAELPGVGRYTAAAIASIAFGEACAVVDGNVERVLRRVSGKSSLAGKPLWQAAQQLISAERAGDFNQAMMELGATVCLPDHPACASCPVARWCETRGAGSRRVVSKRKRKSLGCVLSVQQNSVYLVKRAPQGPMPGMWELPTATPDLALGDPVFELRHSITDTDYEVSVFQGDCPQVASGRWVPKTRAAGLPLTGLTRKILRRSALI